VGRERGPLSLVRINEELLDRNSSGSEFRNLILRTVGIRCANHSTPLLSTKVGTEIRQPVAVVSRYISLED
jgi:hypothetical protein